MISFEEALATILANTPKKNTEKVNFQDALYRVLAQDVLSDMDMPPFNKSAMDGYACRREDLGLGLNIVETIAAGIIPQKAISKGQCCKIMTGAMVPEGADTVIKVEETKLDESGKVLFTMDTTKSNIVKQGEDVRKSEIVLEKGTLIKPQHIAILASMGCVEPEVYQQVKVAVLSTGNEIVEPYHKPGPSQIRNSNAYQLVAQLKRIAALPSYYGIATDSEEESFRLVKKALKENDLVLLTGGVSMGEFDFIPEVLRQLDIKLLFQTVAIQPGKPTVFGLLGKKRIFGLPGNPVSSFNTFELFVKPMILKMMGANPNPLVIRLPMGRDYERKRSGRMSWIPIKISNEGEVIPIEYHGSAHINALGIADGIINIPIGTTKLEKGKLVYVRQI